MKKINIVVLLFVVSSLLISFTLSSVLAQKEIKDNGKSTCSNEQNGIKLCVDSRLIGGKVNEDIKIASSIWNLSSEKIDISYPMPFEYKLINEIGEKLPTAFEKRLIDSGTPLIGANEWKVSLFGRSSRISSINPNETQNQEINVSKVYNFSDKGKYFLSIKTKIPNTEGNGFYELVIEAIEIEVK